MGGAQREVPAARPSSAIPVGENKGLAQAEGFHRPPLQRGHTRALSAAHSPHDALPFTWSPSLPDTAPRPRLLFPPSITRGRRPTRNEATATLRGHFSEIGRMCRFSLLTRLEKKLRGCLLPQAERQELHSEEDRSPASLSQEPSLFLASCYDIRGRDGNSIVFLCLHVQENFKPSYVVLLTQEMCILIITKPKVAI